MKITTTIAIFIANSIAQPAVPFATSPVIAPTFFSWSILFCVAVLMSIFCYFIIQIAFNSLKINELY